MDKYIIEVIWKYIFISNLLKLVFIIIGWFIESSFILRTYSRHEKYANVNKKSTFFNLRKKIFLEFK